MGAVTVVGGGDAGAASFVGAPPQAASMTANGNSSGWNRRANTMFVVGTIAYGRIIHQRRASPAGADAAMARRSSLRFAAATPPQGEHNLAKPNFGYQKRQKELEKKRKKEEKMKKKLEKNAPPAEDAAAPAPEGTEPAV